MIKKNRLAVLKRAIVFLCLYNQIQAAEPVSQTAAQLRAFGNVDFLSNSKVQATFGPGTLMHHKDLIKAILENEKKYFDTHYVFYHGMSNYWYVIQDITKQLYNIKNPTKKIHDDFQLFRVFGNPVYDKYPTVNKFLDHIINSQTEVNDHYTESAQFLLSVNLSLFGNTGKKTESSFYYFIANAGATTVLPKSEIVKSTLRSLGFSDSDANVKKIESLPSLIQNKGGLVQIFIPKKMVNNYAYLARNYGRPYGSPEALGIFFDRTQKQNRLPNFWKLLESKPKAALGNCKETISSMLDKYQKMDAGSFIPNFDELQARIIISNEMLLNPPPPGTPDKDRVIMLRYNGYSNAADKVTLDHYKSQMTNVVKDIAGI